MLTLDLPVEPYWLDLPRGVRVEIRPVTTAVMAAAQAASAPAGSPSSLEDSGGALGGVALGGVALGAAASLRRARMLGSCATGPR